MIIFVKCQDVSCCGEVRLPDQIFDRLKERPQLIPWSQHSIASTKSHFEKYDALKNKDTTEHFMPSFTPMLLCKLYV